MMNSKQLMLTAILVFSLLMSIGCAGAWLAGGAAAGAGTYAYVRGELKSTEEVSLDRAYQATQQAMKDLEFTITSKQKDAFYGEVLARRATGKKVTVKLEKQTGTTTEITIRVGTFGDESLSQEIHKTIKKHFRKSASL